LRRALELEVNFIDTADAYGPETNELLIAEALYPYPKGLVIATKGGNTRPVPGQWVPDGRPEYLSQCVDKSLKRLKLERIAIFINYIASIARCRSKNRWARSKRRRMPEKFGTLDYRK
jgi:pyridoxine 4-dehydrogenase